MPGQRQARTRRRTGPARPARPQASVRQPVATALPGPADLQQRLGNGGAQSWLSAQVTSAAPQPAGTSVVEPAAAMVATQAPRVEAAMAVPTPAEPDTAASATLTIDIPAANEGAEQETTEVPADVVAETDAPVAEAGANDAGGGAGGAQPITDARNLPGGADVAAVDGGGAPGVAVEAGGGGGGPAGAATGETDAAVAGSGGGGGGRGGAEVELLMPPPPEGLSEADQGRITNVSGNARRAGAAQEQLPTAGAGVSEARAAVTEPVEETAARAEGQLVAALGEQPAPSPEIEALCARMREVIHSRQPPDEESLVDSVPRDEAEAAGQTLQTAVEGDTDQVRSGYDQMDETPQGERQQTGDDLNTPPGSVDTPGIGAEQAVPDAVPAENVSLDADTERSAAAIDDAGMTSEPAELVETGPIAEARDAQGELGELAERDPAEVLAEQTAERDSAMSDMAALQAQALEALTSNRASTASTLGTQQTGMVTTEEQLRTQISTQARTIFTTAQTRVDTLLEPLVPTAIRRWETEVAILSGRFDADLRQVKSWLDERYSGVGGTVLELWEGVVGKPDWVTREYNRAEENFGDGVCSLLREISTEINTVIATCEQIIDDANTQIEQLFTDLPEGLQEWAETEKARYAEEVSNLHGRVASARDSLTRDIAGRAAGAVQEVRERIHELRQAAGGLVGRVMDAVGRFLDDPIKFIIEGLLQLVGIPPASFWAVVNKIQSVISDIADDPLNFANNLASALGQGFQRFFDNFADHILGGFFDWLFSGLGAVGVTIPSDFSLKSIITFFLELMGITWPNIRQILARHIGEENVALIEKAYELVANLIELGPEGIFEMIKEQLNPQNILDMVIDAAIDFMIDALIMAVTPRIIAMFNPAGALVQALEVVYRILKWIFENAARIFSLIETVVNGAAELIAGNLSGMATAVEGALARLIAPVIDFLAGFLGLGDLPDKIADTIRGFQEMVLGVIDKVVAWLADKAKSLLKSLGIGGDEQEDDEIEEDDPEKAEQVALGLQAIDEKEQQHLEEGLISEEDAQEVAASVKQEHPVFTSLTVVDGDETWDYDYTASPGRRKPGERKALAKHESKYVTIENNKYMLKDAHRNKEFTRDRCYAKSFNSTVNSWKANLLSTPRNQGGLRHPTKLNWYYYEDNDQYYENKGRYKASVEHPYMVADHWNDTGRKTNQAERKDFYYGYGNPARNLEIVPLTFNSSEGAGSGVSYNYRVTKDFRGPQE